MRMSKITFLRTHKCFVVLIVHTTSVMFRIFLVMASLSWLGVGENQSFWNVSFTSFCTGKHDVKHAVHQGASLVKGLLTKMKTNLDAFFIVDPSNHFHTHLSDLVEVWLLQAYVPEDLNDPFSHTDTRVLCEDKDSSILIHFCHELIKTEK